MGMKLSGGKAMDKTVRPHIQTENFSVQATKDPKTNLINGFNVTIKRKARFVPVVRNNPLNAWLQVYKLIKPYCK